jgi:anthranilate phosphoribosyltransferase
VVEAGRVTEREIAPADFGLPTHPLTAVAGGDAQANAATMRSLLAGEPGPVRDFVLMNAGAALFAAGAAPDLAAGAAAAAVSIDSGKAKQVLERYVALSQAAAGG